MARLAKIGHQKFAHLSESGSLILQITQWLTITLRKVETTNKAERL